MHQKISSHFSITEKVAIQCLNKSFSGYIKEFRFSEDGIQLSVTNTRLEQTAVIHVPYKHRSKLEFFTPNPMLDFQAHRINYTDVDGTQNYTPGNLQELITQAGAAKIEGSNFTLQLSFIYEKDDPETLHVGAVAYNTNNHVTSLFAKSIAVKNDEDLTYQQCFLRNTQEAFCAIAPDLPERSTIWIGTSPQKYQEAQQINTRDFAPETYERFLKEYHRFMTLVRDVSPSSEHVQLARRCAHHNISTEGTGITFNVIED